MSIECVQHLFLHRATHYASSITIVELATNKIIDI